MSDLKTIWKEACARIREAIGDDGLFDSYIATNTPVSLSETTLVLRVDDPFLRDWIHDNYKDIISSAVTVVTGTEHQIEWEVRPRDDAPSATDTKAYAKPEAERATAPHHAAAKVRSNCIGTLNPDLTFETFVKGPSNSFTVSAALAVTQNLGKNYNPLFIYGDTGVGKTHIIQAVGHRVLESGKKVAYVTTEDMLNEYSNAILRQETNEFRNKYRKVDLLLIDDIQFFANKTGIQEEFFHTFNALYQNQKQIIITCDRPAAEVAGLEERLVSRFNAGLSVEMERPNFEMRLAILRYYLMSSDVKLSGEAEMFIAENVTSNVRALKGAMTRALALKRLNNNEPLSLDKLRIALRDLIEDDRKELVTSDAIRKAVCEFYGVKLEDLNEEGRMASIVMPRQVAMYLCRVLLKGSSLPAIAKVFNRTHSNIYHACTKVQKLYNTSEETHRNILTILGKLGQDPSVLND